MTDGRVLYADRRPYVVPDTLDELTGPTTGVVELPLHLGAWSRMFLPQRVRALWEARFPQLTKMPLTWQRRDL